MGRIPEVEEICKLEGLENDDQQEDDGYLSDSGALIVEATRERDRFAGSLRGRHGKKNIAALSALDNAVMKTVTTFEADLAESNSEAPAGEDKAEDNVHEN